MGKIQKQVLSIEIDLITKSDLVFQLTKKDHGYICFANVHMCMESYWKPKIREVVNKADFILADGVPIIASLRLLYSIRQQRIAGMDFMPELMKIAEKNGDAVFFYGSSEKTLRKIEHKAKKDFPDLNIAGILSPPFRELTLEETSDHIKTMNGSGARYFFVSLGCPKQELWMASNHKKINGILLGVGAAFDVYSGVKKMAPEWMRRSGTEWIFRLMQEPGRLFKRYLLTNTAFLLLMSIEFFKIRILKFGDKREI